MPSGTTGSRATPTSWRPTSPTSGRRSTSTTRPWSTPSAGWATASGSPGRDRAGCRTGARPGPDGRPCILRRGGGPGDPPAAPDRHHGPAGGPRPGCRGHHHPELPALLSLRAGRRPARRGQRPGGAGVVLHADERGVPVSKAELQSRVSPDVYVEILNAEGQVVVSRPSGTRSQEDPPPQLPRPAARPAGPHRRPGQEPPAPTEPDVNSVTVPSTASRGPEYRLQATALPGGTLVVATRLDSVNATLTSLRDIELAVSLSVVAALLVLTTVLIRRGLRPLEVMTVEADTIAAGDLTRRVEPVGLRHRDRTPGPGPQRHARPDRGGLRPADALRGAAPAVPRRRLPRAADPADLHPGLRRAAPQGRAPPTRTTATAPWPGSRARPPGWAIWSRTSSPWPAWTRAPGRPPTGSTWSRWCSTRCPTPGPWTGAGRSPSPPPARCRWPATSSGSAS